MSKHQIELSVFQLSENGADDDEVLDTEEIEFEPVCENGFGINNKNIQKLLNENPQYILSKRQITGKIPEISYLVCFIELCERFSYYMITGCLTNMIQRPLPRGSVSGAVLNSNDIPGALNLGLPLANFTLQFLTFFANISPLLSGYLSDSKLGKFNSIKFGIYIGILGHFLLIFSSIPSVMKFPYFAWTVILVSVVIIAFSAGFIKSNILPLLLDQYELHEDKPDFKVENDRVYAINHKATLDNLSISFYMFINWGCTFSLFGSFIERSFGFWPIYLSTALLFSCLPLVLNFVNKRLILSKPKKSVDTQVYLEFYYHLKNYLFSSSIPVTNSIKSVSIFDIKNFINCLTLFMFFIPFYLNVSALTSIQISLGATMYNSLNMPNDIYQAINPLTIILILPLLSNLIYPFLLKVNKLPTSKAKILVGFVLSSLGTLLGAYVQNEVYSNSNCPLDSVSNCDTKSHVSIITWICYFSMFILQASGECFAATTVYELAYELSPTYLKGSILGLFLMSVALSSLFGEVLSIWSKDPYLVELFIFTGTLGLVSTIFFYRWSQKINL